MKRDRNLAELFFNRARRWPDRVFLERRVGETLERWTWKECHEKVRALAGYLDTQGLRPNEPCAILSENRPEWIWTDLSILTTQSYDVPLYATSTAEEILFCLNHSRSRFLFLSNKNQLDKIRKIEDRLEHLETIIIYDPCPKGIQKLKMIELKQCIEEGNRALKEGRVTEQDSHKIPRDALASIIYTSGTTGRPKGVMLTHANFLSNVQSVSQIVPITNEDHYLSFLPLNHVFERMAGLYLMLDKGARITYIEDMDTLKAEILKNRPTLMFGVPRFFEKIYNGIWEKVNLGSPLKKKIFLWALSVGKKRLRCHQKNKQPDLLLRLLLALASTLVFNKIKKGLGGRLRFLVSGGAALPQRIGEFFFSVGITILEGYGLTETSPVIAFNRIDHFRFGTVGHPIPGIEVRILDDGEIQTRGPHVMKGYLGLEKETSEVLNSDGWFSTGDIGHFDKEGFLVITDRKKDILVTSGGKNVCPQVLENLLKGHPVVLQAHIHGNGKKYIVALIVANMAQVARQAAAWQLSCPNGTDFTQHPRIRKWIASIIHENQKCLSRYHQIKYFCLLKEEFTHERGELTPTLKLKRRVIDERYSQKLSAMYGDSPEGIPVT